MVQILDQSLWFRHTQYGAVGAYTPTAQTTRLALHADAYIPARFREMACRRCADACPTGALVATSEGPALASACVDGGRCTAACPAEALSVPGFDITPTTSGMVAIDCRRVPPTHSPSGAMRVPCLGDLSTVALTG